MDIITACTEHFTGAARIERWSAVSALVTFTGTDPEEFVVMGAFASDGITPPRQWYRCSWGGWTGGWRPTLGTAYCSYAKAREDGQRALAIEAGR